MKHMITDEADGMTGHGRPMPSGRKHLEAKCIEIRCMNDKGMYGMGNASNIRWER